MLVALCGLGALFSIRSYQDERARAVDATQALAVGAAANADRFVQGRLQLLAAVASAHAFTHGEVARIDDILRRVQPARRGFSGAMAWIDATGVVRAASRPIPGSLDVGDRRYVREVLATGRQAVSEGILARLQKAPVVVLAVPTRDADGRINGLLNGAIRLDTAGVAQAALRYDGAAVRIVDRDGNVIVGPGPVSAFRRGADPATLALMHRRGRGVLDDDARVVGGAGSFTGYAVAPAAGWVVLVDRPVSGVLASPRRTVTVELALLALAALLGAVGSIVFARRLNRATRRDDDARRRAVLLSAVAGDLLADLDERAIGLRVFQAGRDELGSTGATLVARTGTGPERVLRYGDEEEDDGGTRSGAGLRPSTPDAVAGRPFVVRSAEGVAVAVDLETEGRPVGRLAIRWPADREPDADELAFVSLLGLTAAQAIERCRLFREERLARGRIEGLQRITSTLSAAATSGDVFATVAGAAGEAVGARYCSVALLTPDGRALRVLSRHGDNPGRPDEVDVDGRDPLAVAVRGMRPAFSREGGAAATSGAGMVEAALPLIDGGRALGAMLVHFEEPRAFDGEEVDHLGAVARHIAQALVRASYLDAERRARSRAEALQRVGVRLAGAADVEAVATVAVEHGLTALGARGGGVYLGDGAEVRRVPRGAAGTERGRALAARAHRAGEDDALTADDGDGGVCMALALRVGAHGVGALVASFPPGAAPDEDARRALLTLADMVAQALERARLVEREGARRRRAEMLERVGGELLAIDGSEERLRLLADLLVPDLADFATVERPEPDGRYTVAAVRHRDPALEGPLRLLRERHRLRPEAPHSVARVYAEGRPDIIPEISDALMESLTPDDETLSLLRRIMPRSHAGVPLRSGDDVLAVLVLGMGPGDRRFSPDDEEFLLDLASRAGVAVERAVLFEREHQIAQELQRSLLGPPPVSGDDVLVAARYRPGESGMEIGGDWHGVMRLPDGSVACTVGDVVGRGLEAAAAMGRLRSALDALAPVSDGPAEVLDRLETFADGLEGARLATVAYTIIDPLSGLVRYACAGHPPPLVVEPGRPARFLWGGRSGPVGAFAATRGSEASEVLPPDAALLLYSDGLFERRGELVDAGLERLRAAAEECAEMGVEEMADAVIARLLPGGAGGDDVVLLVVRPASAREPAFLRRFAARAEELAVVRQGAREWLVDAGISRDRADDLILAIGEATANAVEHAYLTSAGSGDVEVRMRRDRGRGIEAVVSDSGAWRDPPAPGGRGRGTGLMEALVDDLVIERRGHGTRVLMRMAGDAESARA